MWHFGISARIVPDIEVRVIRSINDKALPWILLHTPPPDVAILTSKHNLLLDKFITFLGSSNCVWYVDVKDNTGFWPPEPNGTILKYL